MSPLLEEKLETLKRVFRTSPVDDEEVIVGREKERDKCLALRGQKGAHGIIIGERGVGKSSLANLVRLKLGRYAAAKCNCLQNDTHEALWQRVFDNILVDNILSEEGELLPVMSLTQSLGATDFSAATVLEGLRSLAPRDTLIILDEFNALGPSFDRGEFVGVLKYVSDTFSHVNFLLVGVAESVAQLIGESESIRRNLRPIRLQPLGPAELRQIIGNGIAALDMTAIQDIANVVLRESSDKAENVHFLCHHACWNSLDDGRLELTQADVEAAVDMLGDRDGF